MQVEGLKAGDSALTEHKDFNEYVSLANSYSCSNWRLKKSIAV
jgi:hypothetical protein